MNCLLASGENAPWDRQMIGNVTTIVWFSVCMNAPDTAGSGSAMRPPRTAAATFCATLVDEWVRAGVTSAFVAAPSGPTPLALALAEHAAISVHYLPDERSVGFAALGHGLRSPAPGIAVCSSGAAGAHLHGVVIEADRSAVPLVVVTVGQALDPGASHSQQADVQSHLYGSSVRFYDEPGVPRDAQRDSWRSLGSRSILEAIGWSGRPGPAHLNLDFRGPAEGIAGDLPSARPGRAPWHQTPRRPPAMLADLPPLAGRSGVIVAGNGTEGPNAVLSLADALGWPVLADHSSGCRAPGTIVHFDSLLRTSEFVDGLSPEVVLRFGEPLASRQLSRWLAGLDAEFVSVVPDGRWLDPEGRADIVINDGKAVLSFLAAVDGPPSREVDVWRWVDTVAGDAIETTLEAVDGLTEPTIAREVVGGIESGSALVVAASLPERDVESYGPQRDDIEVFATTSNGGGGAVATAIGVASTGVPTTVLLDDGALLSDSSSLVGLGESPLDLTMVVVGDSPGRGAPYRPDIEALATAHGLAVHRWGQVAEARDGVRIVLASTDHDKDLQLRNQLNTAASEAVTAALKAARQSVESSETER